MPPRPRQKRYRNLPENLHYDTSAGLYRYRNPITRKATYLSNDKAACIKAAKTLNLRLMPARGDLVARVVGGGQTWTMAVYKYEAERAPDEQWSDKTRAQYLSYLRKLRGCQIASMAMADIEVIHIVDALDQITSGKRMRNVYRHLMIKVFAYAINIGWCGENPAELTLKASEKRQRMRLTMDGYQAVYAQAEPWLRNAMDLCLITLQRPEDLVMAQYIDVQDGRLWIRQQKTGTKLRISVGAELQAVLEASRDGRLCPYILHCKPQRIRKSKLKTHPFQLTVDQLGKAFAATRDACGHYRQADKPPPFYEIKSLGGDRYRQLGWREEQIQALYGHDEQSTTDGYLSGHEAPWEDVDCG